MLHFNQRNWFRMSPDDAASETLPEPRNRKEFYLSLLAGHTPTKKKVLFSGYGEYHIKSILSAVSADVPTIVIPAPSTNEDVTVILGNQECQYAASVSDYLGASYRYMYSDSEIWIHVSSEADAANKVVIFKTVELTPPEPKTATEFYLAKMAGVEVVDHIEKVFESEFTFPTEASGKSSGYVTTISNAYDETIDASHLIVRIDGNDDHSFVVDIHGGSVTIKTPYVSYAGTTHTLELFYKTVVEDVPVKTRTEQYLKAIAANQNSSDSSDLIDPLSPAPGRI